MISNRESTQLRSLRQKKFRKKYARFLIEGKRLVEEAVFGNADIIKVWYTTHVAESERGKHLITELAEKAIPHEETTPGNLKSISVTVHGQGIIALLNLSEQKELVSGKNDNWVYLDNVRDPGNLGTIFRTADWFGIKYVGLSKRCVDTYNSKVVRSGMGAHFHLNIFPSTTLCEIKALGHTIVAADQRGRPILTNHVSPLPSPVGGSRWCLVLGSEAFGISDADRPHIDHTIGIPGSGSIESLNVAVAAGILLHHLT